MSDSYEVQIMRQFQNICDDIGGSSEYWNDVDMTIKANVSAYIQTRKNTQYLLDFLKQNRPVGHSENYIYEWTKELSLCERGEAVKALKEAASGFGNDAYAFSFMMSMMKNIQLLVEEYQQIMEPRF